MTSVLDLRQRSHGTGSSDLTFDPAKKRLYTPSGMPGVGMPDPHDIYSKVEEITSRAARGEALTCEEAKKPMPVLLFT